MAIVHIILADSHEEHGHLLLVTRCLLSTASKRLSKIN
jgi:hypothetical protein